MALSIERLRSPRSPRRASGSIFFSPEHGEHSASSTPFASAPSSPRFYYYYSAPSSPRRSANRAAELDAGVPFAWEEKPGTPKRSCEQKPSSSSPASPSATAEVVENRNSVDYLSRMGMGFHFSAPVSPRHDLQSSVVHQPEDEFEFASARMSEADSSVTASFADELFFQGQLLPLKLPPRLQHQQQSRPQSLQQEEGNLSLRSRGGGFVHQLHSPRSSAATKAHQRSHSLFLGGGGGGGGGSNSFEALKRSAPVQPAPKTRRSLRQLLNLGPSSSSKQQQQQQQQQSRSSSISSTSSSGSSRFTNSRSSSKSSNSSSRNSVSSRQVTPVSSRELLHYGKVANKNVEELRKRTFMPYKQGLLGWLDCVRLWPGIREES